MKRVTINALVDIGCLIAFVPSLQAYWQQDSAGKVQAHHPDRVVPA